MTGQGSLYPGQKPPSGLLLWVRWLGDEVYALVLALGWGRRRNPPDGR